MNLSAMISAFEALGCGRPSLDGEATAWRATGGSQQPWAGLDMARPSCTGHLDRTTKGNKPVITCFFNDPVHIFCFSCTVRDRYTESEHTRAKRVCWHYLQEKVLMQMPESLRCSEKHLPCHLILYIPINVLRVLVCECVSCVSLICLISLCFVLGLDSRRTLPRFEGKCR